MKAVIGLGNPDARYRMTRHNMGLELVSALQEKHPEQWRDFRKEKLMGETEATVWISKAVSSDAILAKPLRYYMNETYRWVPKLLETYGVSPEEALVVCDDVALPCGKLRIRRSGSSAGHKGLQSIMDALGTENFPRLRIGIGRAGLPKDLSEFVLARFEEEEKETILQALEKAIEAVACWFERGIDEAMKGTN